MSKSFAKDFMSTYDGLVLPDDVSMRFDVLECLSKNDYGETYLLLEKGSGKRYVLKQSQKSDHIGRESEILSGLSHEGLPAFEPEIETEEALFVLREYVEGVPLDEYLMEHTVGRDDAVNIVLELCDILSYLHSQPAPIIHRDIKPSNIIINPNSSKVTLIDFGISRKYSETADADTFCFGTQKFSPPEQYGFSQTDCRADIYALGVVLRYLLTGTTNGSTDDKGDALERIAAKCSAFSPKERFQSAQALKRALIMQKKRIKRKTLITALAALAAIMVFVAGIAIGRHTKLFSAPAFNAKNPNEEIYIFIEPLAEKAARLALGKQEGEPVLREELKDIRAVYIVGDRVAKTQEEWYELIHSSGDRPYGSMESLIDIGEMENLSQLNIFREPLSDLSPLSQNKQLRHVQLMHCPVSDASPLSDLPWLDNVEIFGGKLEDFSVFENSKTLTGLGLGGSYLSDISELGDIRKIERLNINATKLTSLAGIERAQRLVQINLDNTAINDFSPLDKLPNLEEIYISANMEEYVQTMENKNVRIFVNK